MKCNYKIIDYFIQQLPFAIRKRVYTKFDMRIGSSSFIARGCFIDNPANVRIGDNCNFNYSCEFHSGVSGEEHICIGNHVWCACHVKFITITHELGSEKQRAGKAIFKPIVVGNGCWIGAGATILPGVTIGDGCVIAAGAVVHKDCEPNGLYGGVPARLLKRLPKS